MSGRRQSRAAASQLEDERRLTAIGRVLMHERDLPTLHEALLNAAMLLMRADKASLQLLNADGTRVDLVASSGLHPDSVAYWKEVGYGSDSACGQALAGNLRAMIADVETLGLEPDSPSLHHYRLSEIRAVQSTPLIGRDGKLVGVLSTHWRKPHVPTSFALARFDKLAHDAAEALDRSRNDAALHVLLAERDLLLKELQHRVKNNLQVVSSLLDLQARHADDPAVANSLAESRNRVLAIGVVHEMLYESPLLSRVDLGKYCRRLVDQVVAAYDLSERVEVRFPAQEIMLDLRQAVPIGLILNEIVSNACKHAYGNEKGKLALVLRCVDDTVFLEVDDLGVGFPAGLGDADGPSFGAHLMSLLARQFGGSVQFASEGGTRIRVELPLSPRAERRA